jgi:putative ABC transport system permease protein
MIKNYFTIAFRNFWRNKLFSAINVMGLAIGISAALVIFLIVYYEYSFDAIKDSDRIYRVVLDAKFNGTEGHSAGIPAPLGSAIENEITGVDQTIPVFQFQGDATAQVQILKKETGNPVVIKKQPDIVFTNRDYFLTLPFEWITGSLQTSLEKPFSVVLTESRALQYFGGIPYREMIGREIMYNNNLTATVSGIVRDLNKNTSFNAVEFISLPTIAKTNLQQQFMMNVWNDWMAYAQLYIKLSKGTDATKMEAQLNKLFKKYNKNAYKDANNMMRFHLQPLSDVHFNTNYQGVGQRTANRSVLYGLLTIATFLLLLGCINFINLTTAHASHRAKEIGIRKTMGSSKKQLVFQFLGETVFLTSIATVLSVLITPLLLKVFQDFIPEGLQFDLLHQPSLIVFLLLLIATVSFLSGLYPALILSGYKPVTVLKNQAFTTSSQTRNAWVRKSLTVFQFVIAQFFVIATVIVQKQINYSLNADLGFNKEAIINFNLPRDTVAGHAKQLLAEIKSIPGLAMASTGFLAPADEGVAFTNLEYDNGKEKITPNTQIRWGDPDFIKVYDIKILAGRNVQASDSIKEFLVNESYARAIGFTNPEDALNKQVNWNGKKLPIIGVMKDFRDQSTRALISPVVFAGNNGSTFHIRLLKNNADRTLWKNVITQIEKSFKRIYPEEDFSYSFLDDTIANFYRREQQTAKLLSWATGLAIFISCLGLLGLVMYTINTRTKEIGIRKVLGASIVSIVTILSTHFIRLIFVAFVIATPLAWWAMYQWLQDFAYRTPMSWWLFIVSGLAMLLIASLILSIQLIKAAMANPVKSLRSE